MNNINSTSIDSSDFLQILSNIDSPPKSLWYLGKLPHRAPTVAIVGSRKPTTYGREIVRDITGKLARAGIIIVSGLAIGHDGLAHRACVEAGGTTVAVLPAGLDKIYPQTNHTLARQIIESGGALVSEYAPGTPVMKHHFLQRNRLISGLADVVIVIEAGLHSGTLNTAAHALSQGKEVMAVPGNITAPLSMGCNRLISQGAIPLLSVDDILAKLNINITEPTTNKIRFDMPLAQIIYDLICDGIRDGDALLLHSHADTSEFNMALTMLELNGYIQPLGGNQWGRV